MTDAIMNTDIQKCIKMINVDLNILASSIYGLFSKISHH